MIEFPKMDEKLVMFYTLALAKGVAASIDGTKGSGIVQDDRFNDMFDLSIPGSREFLKDPVVYAFCIQIGWLFEHHKTAYSFYRRCEEFSSKSVAYHWVNSPSPGRGGCNLISAIQENGPGSLEKLVSIIGDDSLKSIMKNAKNDIRFLGKADFDNGMYGISLHGHALHEWDSQENKFSIMEHEYDSAAFGSSVAEVVDGLRKVIGFTLSDIKNDKNADVDPEQLIFTDAVISKNGLPIGQIPIDSVGYSGENLRSYFDYTQRSNFNNAKHPRYLACVDQIEILNADAFDIKEFAKLTSPKAASRLRGRAVEVDLGI
ncbi:hypothetical protein [Pseudomonas putida]|uniref:Uncharacterized protein n=1 Tax=Pseudomonas putida TaxID=303 RepID=A0A8I1EB03_PSEPU|nr:hypothetical protein [Pseudomonas putida]MBI6882672.1 hypothetical protein [Pseudomonas putida]